MKYIIFYGAIIIFWICGLFIFTQTIYPLLYALPKANALKKQDKLKQQIPFYRFILPPIIGIAFFILITWLTMSYFNSYKRTYYIGLGIGLVQTLLSSHQKEKYLEEDFKNAFKDYLK